MPWPTPPEFNPSQARITISPDQAPGAQDTVGHPVKFTITYGEVSWLEVVQVLIRDPSKSPDSTIYRSFPVEGISFRHTFDSPGPKTLFVTATYRDGTMKTFTLDYLVRNPQDPAKDTYTLTVITDDTRGSVSPAIPADVPTGESTRISATAREGFVFDEWKVTAGTATINDPRTASTTVTLQSDAIVRAFFVPAASVLCTLTVVTGENGTVIIDPDTTIFTPGDSVLLTARPNAGFYFGGWEGDTIGLESSIMVKMTKNISVSAIFTEEGKVSLTVSAQNGRIDRSPDHQSYSKGDTVTLTATPDAGYRFVSWSGTLGNTNPLNLILNESMQVTATFARLKYRLTLNSDTGGTITAPSLPDSVEHGVATTITASAAAGYTFAGWRVTSGSATIGDSTKATTTVTLTSGNATVRAIFTQSAFTLTIPQPTNGAVVQVPANKTTFAHGETVTLTARPATGYYFGGWGGDTLGTDTSITVTMTRNRTISATFTIIGSLTLTTTATNGTISKNPNKTSYQYGDLVTLTAIPNTGYTFSTWGSGASGSSNPVTITMDDHKAVTATFTIKRYALSITAVNGTVSKLINNNVVTTDIFDSNTTVTLTATGNIGYQFASWSGDVTGTTATTTVTMNSAKAVTANFSAVRYTITYNNLSNGQNSASNPTSYRIDTATINLAPATRTGYTFGGWFDNSNLSGTAVTTIPSGSTGAKAFWAKWTGSQYTVTLNRNGGSGGSGTVTATYGSSMPAATQPAWAGYRFDGYFDAPTGGKQYYSSTMTSMSNWDKASNATLTARWTMLPPTVNNHPFNTTVNAGQPATFSVNAEGAGTLSYQWQRKPSGGQFQAIPGAANSASYTLSSANESDNGAEYRCVVTNGGGSITSGAAILTVSIWVINNGTLTDPDGNTYTTVVIGNQVWTVENLRTTKYNDGASIPHVTDSSQWANLNTPGYCFYNNSTNVQDRQKWGALYNWYAVNTGKLAPAGWRAPTHADWNAMENHLIVNGYNWDGTTSGNKIAKAVAAQTAWFEGTEIGVVGSNLSQNNRSGFSALPAGSRGDNGIFNSQIYGTNWWSATENGMAYAYDRRLNFTSEGLDGYYYAKKGGFSVRLVRNLD